MAEGAPRIAVVGTGWWATQFHIPSLVGYEAADLVALADPDPAKLTTAAERYGVETTYADPYELFKAGIAEGVVIAVPHAYHYELAKAALEAGLHVLIEKPMVLTAADAWDLVATARATGRHLTVGYTYHHTRAATMVREAIISGQIGELVHISGLFSSMVESYLRGRPEDYRDVFNFPVTGPGERTYSDPAIAGGGQGHLQVTHAMGMVLWATDERVDEVAAFMNERDLAVDLADGIAYRTTAGTVGTMGSTGSLAPGQPPQQEFRYYGTEGFVLQDLLGGTASVHRNDGSSETLDPPLSDDEVYPAGAPSRSLADLIAGHGENRAPAEPAARTVEFLEAAYRSSVEGRIVRTAELTE